MDKSNFLLSAKNQRDSNAQFPRTPDTEHYYMFNYFLFTWRNFFTQLYTFYVINWSKKLKYKFDSSEGSESKILECSNKCRFKILLSILHVVIITHHWHNIKYMFPNANLKNYFKKVLVTYCYRKHYPQHSSLNWQVFIN